MHKSQAVIKKREKKHHPTCSPGLITSLFNATKKYLMEMNTGLKDNMCPPGNTVFGFFSSQGKATHWPVLALLMSLHSFWSNNTKGLFCFWRATKTYYIRNHLSGTKRQSSWVLDCSNNSHWDKASAAIASEKPPLLILILTICWEELERDVSHTGPCEHHICLTLSSSPDELKTINVLLWLIFHLT